MGRGQSNPIRSLVTVFLAVCVSVCCCQTHFLVHAVAGPESGGDTTVASCCSSGSCEGQASDPASHPTPTPDPEPDRPEGCKQCCIKGSGLKDATPVLPAPVVVEAMPVPLPAIAVQPAAAEPVAVFARCPIPPPRTLLRLHCALIV